jgi:hypothetical protein
MQQMNLATYLWKKAMWASIPLFAMALAHAAPVDFDPVRKSAQLSQTEMDQAWDHFALANKAVLEGKLLIAHFNFRAGLAIHPFERDVAANAAAVAEALGRYGDALTFYQLSTTNLKLNDPLREVASRGIHRAMRVLKPQGTDLTTCLVLGMRARGHVVRKQCDVEQPGPAVNETASRP